jgi:hypothetical protein
VLEREVAEARRKQDEEWGVFDPSDSPPPIMLENAARHQDRLQKLGLGGEEEESSLHVSHLLEEQQQQQQQQQAVDDHSAAAAIEAAGRLGASGIGIAAVAEAEHAGLACSRAADHQPQVDEQDAWAIGAVSQDMVSPVIDIMNHAGLDSVRLHSLAYPLQA